MGSFPVFLSWLFPIPSVSLPMEDSAQERSSRGTVRNWQEYSAGWGRKFLLLLSTCPWISEHYTLLASSPFPGSYITIDVSYSIADQNPLIRKEIDLG